MSDNDLFTAWINLSKYYERIFKSLDHILQEQFQLGTKEFYLMYYLEQTEKKR
ncbi:hypothetical protein GCM10025857_65780 [Alicyclobacillus contaminans]|uniref:Uncharacterized protein n=1 Tax=Tetragenococcus osmophilus TaxID=526944 RepID=A0AA37XJB2_9ENTE|nr:hypothetical protein [Tetragenococcus osmophilus]GMA55221.1 hypothetical protein GCM10025857_65780 [Alicyclobacillus contaminans]GMA71011.1 hypothetical protein GCM10025885_00600 [Tetragenococcus osmophilus]